MKKKALLLVPAMFGLLIGGCNKSEEKPASEEAKTPTTENTPISQASPTSNENPTSQTTPVSSATQVPVSASSYVPPTSSSQANPSSSSMLGTSSSHNPSSSQQPASSSMAPSTTSQISTSSSAPIPVVYTITFNSQGGSAVSSIAGVYGTIANEPAKPTLSGYKFTGWSLNADGSNQVSWPYTITGNVTMYANWNEKVDIKGYFSSLLNVLNHDPYSYIPSKMKKDNSGIRVTSEEVNYNFNNSTSVSNIKYGGFGEQWHMVIENIEQSELFYSVLAVGETAINASVVLFNNYLDNNPGDTASHKLNETTYTASIDFHNGLLTYSIQYKTNLDIPFFGNVMPQVDMTYNVTSLEKTVRIQLTENNAMKYSVTDDQYVFGLQYGVETVSRKAYFSLNRNEDESVEGHIYEFVQYKDKDLVPACADFYINEDYTTVVGNKARGLAGFKGYINELYKTNEGKLLGYEVRETLTIAGVTGQYNTLWFNLNNITGITSVKAVENENNTGTYSNKNPHDICLNGSASIFEPAYNTKLLVKTSRKYDVELRKQYFYGYQDDKLVEYETNIPMMFIQDDNDKDTNFSDFPTDMATKSGIPASVNLSETYLDKIRDDYANLIDVFIEHKDDVSGDTITDFVGSAQVI